MYIGIHRMHLRTEYRDLNSQHASSFHETFVLLTITNVKSMSMTDINTCMLTVVFLLQLSVRFCTNDNVTLMASCKNKQLCVRTLGLQVIYHHSLLSYQPKPLTILIKPPSIKNDLHSISAQKNRAHFLI